MMDNQRAECDDIEAEVAKRLRPVCLDMTPDEFDDLVRTAALIQYKYEQRRDREARILFGVIADSPRRVDRR